MLRSLEITASLASWYQFESRKSDASFKQLAEKANTRDLNTCQYCGFQSAICMDVVNADHNVLNNELDNLVTACPLCSQCHFLEHVGEGDNGGGTLIYLPEISQGVLNGHCHVLFCAMTSTSTMYSEAQEAYRQLKSRSQIVEDYFGEGMSQPSVMGRAILDSHVKDTREKGLRLLKNVRLLPSRSGFKGLIDQWSNQVSHHLMQESAS